MTILGGIRTCLKSNAYLELVVLETSNREHLHHDLQECPLIVTVNALVSRRNSHLLQHENIKRNLDTLSIVKVET